MPVSFGEFTLDEARRLLLDGDQPVRLSPKAFQLLTILVDARPRAISKKDLQDQLWPDTFVTEGNLASLITEIRSALHDDRKEPRFIRTLYGFGYSFAGAPAETPKPRPKTKRWAIAGAVALIALAATLSLRSMNPSSDVHSIAVLPFDTSAVDAADAHLGIGLPDLLISRLSNIDRLTVRPTSAIRTFAGRHVDSREAGKALDVDAVLEGSIRTSADRVRVTVQLLDLHRGKTIWADRFDEKRSEMFTIEDNVSARVADALMIHLTRAEKSRLSKRFTTDSAAYQLYIQGRYHLDRGGAGGTKQEAEQALDFYRRAVAQDPRYALGWAGVAYAYVMLGSFSRQSPHEVWPKAEEAALRAIHLDDNVSDGHGALAAVRMYKDLDYAGAEREFHRALDLNPRNATALTGYGFLLQCLGRFDEAIAIRKRQVAVNPLDTNAHWGLANGYLTAGRYDDALREVRIVLGMDPQYREAHVGLIRILIARGEFDQAVADARNLVTFDSTPRALAFLGYALAKAGKKDEARQVLATLEARSQHEFVSSFNLVVVLMALGDREASLKLLDRALSEREYALRLKTEPVLDPLRGDPRFAALLHRAGFNS